MVVGGNGPGETIDVDLLNIESSAQQIEFDKDILQFEPSPQIWSSQVGQFGVVNSGPVFIDLEKKQEVQVLDFDQGISKKKDLDQTVNEILHLDQMRAEFGDNMFQQQTRQSIINIDSNENLVDNDELIYDNNAGNQP